jgi:hypothetical protein
MDGRDVTEIIVGRIACASGSSGRGFGGESMGDAMGATASNGEAATIAMVDTAQRMFDVLRSGDVDSSKRVQALHAEYEGHCNRVREAAAMLDSQALAQPATTDATQLEALRRERQQLRDAIAVRDRDLKEQIDMLRQLLLATQVMSGGSN